MVINNYQDAKAIQTWYVFCINKKIINKYSFKRDKQRAQVI